MAERKLLFLDTDGFPTEHDPDADSITLGGLTMDAGGTGIDMNQTKVSDMADGTAATDAVTLQQLQAISAGIDLKESVRLKSTADMSTWTPAGSGIGATLTAPTDATSHNDFDSVTAVLGDRIMVNTAGSDDVTADTENGIYTVTALGNGAGTSAELTRATDFDENAEVTHGGFAFITEGTLHANEGWAIATPDPITVDTTAIIFTQFQGLPSFVWGAGILNTSGTISAELDTAADAQGAGTAGGSSGLEFDAAGDAGQLRAAVNATAGLERTATGLAAKLDGTTLQSAAAGLSVKGLPSLFEVNAVAVGAAVTAANLDTLTDGSNADALHVHSGADEAQRIETAYTSDGTGVTKGDPVFVSANDVVSSADASNNNARKYIGLAKTTVGATAAVDVIGGGVLTGVTVAGTPTAGDLVYLANGGGLTDVRPTTSGDHVLVVGKMKNATDVDTSHAQYLGKVN